MTNFDKFKRASAADRYRFLDGTAPSGRFLDIIALSRRGALLPGSSFSVFVLSSALLTKGSR